MKTKLLITGAAGFIGYHASLRLQQEGCLVIGLDNFNDYYDPQLKRARQARLAEQGITVVEQDLCNQAALESIAAEHRIDQILHLAAQAGVRYSLVNPGAYISSNIQGFLSILEVCRRNPHIQLVYASSSSVYGLNKKTPFSTDDPTDAQASLYGVTKKTNELMASTYHHLYGISAVGLRFFTVYGPWGRPDMAYFHFTKSILEGKEIPVFNFGQLERDFTYIDDIVNGIGAALKRPAGCEVFNLGNHQPVALNDFIAEIENCLGKKAIRKELPMQPGDVHATFADISKSREKLGFYPKTSLKEGLPKFIEWYQEYYGV